MATIRASSVEEDWSRRRNAVRHARQRVRVARAQQSSGNSDNDFRLGERFDEERKQELREQAETDASDSEEGKIPEASTTVVDRTASIVETVLIMDFFFVVVAALLLVVALIARGNSTDNGPLLNAWLRAWPVFQGAISVLIAGILGERLLKWLKNTGFFGGESGSVSR